MKNSYNLVRQIRKNIFSIYHIFYISFIKTLMGKLRETFLCAHCLVKNLSLEILIKLIKGKEYNMIHLNEIIYIGYHKPCKSLSLIIPMPLTHLSKITKHNNFVNKSV
jgi:hypothetical protein